MIPAVRRPPWPLSLALVSVSILWLAACAAEMAERPPIPAGEFKLEVMQSAEIRGHR